MRVFTYVMGLTAVVLGSVLVLALYTNDQFSADIRHAINEALGRRLLDEEDTISGQVLVNLSESVVEVRNRSYLGPLETGRSSGTGVIVTEVAPWRVLTAAHVPTEESTGLIAGRQVIVRTPGGDWSEAEVLWRAYGEDIALLEATPSTGIQGLAVTAPPFGAATPVVGDTVATRCYFDTKMRTGKVLEFVSRVGGQLNFIVGIPSKQGCSGAPVVNSAGELIGLVIKANAEASIALALPPLSSEIQHQIAAR